MQFLVMLLILKLLNLIIIVIILLKHMFMFELVDHTPLENDFTCDNLEINPIKNIFLIF